MNLLMLIGIGLISIVTLAVAAVVILVLWAAWVASGSPDVNGDPERDGGMDQDDIRAMSAHWDHGSYRTHRVPDLETARQLNRLHLQQDVEQLSTFNRITHHG